jgi:hypothetical protein
VPVPHHHPPTRFVEHLAMHVKVPVLLPVGVDFCRFSLEMLQFGVGSTPIARSLFFFFWPSRFLEFDIMDDRSIRDALSRYRFYHCIRVTENITTTGEAHLELLQAPFRRLMESIDFNGLKVLDIGCRDGLFSFQAEKLGATEIIGIDGCLSKGATEFLIPFFQSKVRMVEKNLLDLTADEFGLLSRLGPGPHPQGDEAGRPAAYRDSRVPW